jgi:glutamyl-tRNA reductase
VTAAKKVKTGMQTSMANTSAVSHCMEMLRSQGYQFAGKTCMVIGNGKMGKLAAQALREAGAQVTVTVRQYRSGVVEIPAGCERIDYGRRMELLPSCDLIVSATTSPNVTIKYDDVLQTAWKAGVIFVDLAVPRDIDPQVAQLPGATLYDIDSFKAPQSEALEELRAWADGVLEQQIQEFLTWYDCRDMIPLTNDLSKKFAADSLFRMEPAMQALHLDAAGATELRCKIEDMAQKQFRKLLFAVRDEAGAAAFRQCLEAVEKLYE